MVNGVRDRRDPICLKSDDDTAADGAQVGPSMKQACLKVFCFPTRGKRIQSSVISHQPRLWIGRKRLQILITDHRRCPWRGGKEFSYQSWLANISIINHLLEPAERESSHQSSITNHLCPNRNVELRKIHIRSSVCFWMSSSWHDYIVVMWYQRLRRCLDDNLTRGTSGEIASSRTTMSRDEIFGEVVFVISLWREPFSGFITTNQSPSDIQHWCTYASICCHQLCSPWAPFRPWIRRRRQENLKQSYALVWHPYPVQ